MIENSKMPNPAMEMSPQAKEICDFLDERKAEDIAVFDVSGISPFASYYVIATAPNHRALGAIAELLEDKLEQEGLIRGKAEGTSDSGWIIVESEDVIVHLFTSVNRKEFALEDLIAKIAGESKSRADAEN